MSDRRHERKIPVDSPEAKEIAVAYAKAVTERIVERTTGEGSQCSMGWVCRRGR